MADITQTITVYSGTVPDASSMTHSEFDSAAVQLTNYWQVIPGELNAWASQANSLKSDANSILTTTEEWATQIGSEVGGVDFSAKEWAVGITADAGSAKKWATQVGAKVDGVEYSAKEYATGSVVETGSAKKWATHMGSEVDGDFSSKYYSRQSDIAARSAAATAGYSGAWSDQSGGISSPVTVSHAGNVWFLINDLADVTTSEPAHDNPDWFSLGGLANYDLGVTVQPYDEYTSKTNLNEEFTGRKKFNEVEETVYTVTGATPLLTPANGTIQTWTLSANSTPTADFRHGQFLLLLIDGTSLNTITWSGVINADNWVPFKEPPDLEEETLTRVVLWKIGATMYGAY